MLNSTLPLLKLKRRGKKRKLLEKKSKGVLRKERLAKQAELMKKKRLVKGGRARRKHGASEKEAAMRAAEKIDTGATSDVALDEGLLCYFL